MPAATVVSAEHVERTIAAFARLDQRGDRKAMNKLALRLQREQPVLLQRVAAVKDAHGDAVGEAAVFYATLIWAMFDRANDGTLPRLTQQNLDDADAIVRDALAAVEGLTDKPAHERVAPALTQTQPEVYAKLVSMVDEDVREAAMTPETAATIIVPTEVVIEAFDAALSGRRAGERQGTIVSGDKVGRNDPCPCGSGKKYKKCHGEAA
jgi:hypothetical protein